MGGRLARMFRNFNVENRALREISKDKPRAAPRYPDRAPPPSVSAEAAELVKKKDESLLGHLRSVYVESTDPAAAAAEVSVSDSVAAAEGAERRPLRVSFPGHMFGLAELSDVPKGKLTIAEALKALGSHQHQPQTWTAEKIAQEYSLDLKETKSLMEFFIPFKVEIIPPKTRTAKQIKAS
ncbi:PREDICTED: NADH dehydrogenase [ubiquinone] 1 alpha subcomplex assembly factor 4 isoform X2 [Cyprinodon variegatus]|uniref:NADH dehydrogenase [ubiquinone] 1 alpha subcomplex assembly factor 4 isoform X1 n=1 Tax=Cyprinodon variegatus TaxID=28743 RepID=UPI0007425065|nr:PREDICTED: NADH dehydrogenase [ubiquinone] 1 alpha subcomplex assembly factor 4 isoform X1 [Cyprinodon variegatus]XP_015260391.1 PREDICTED: NADH dehydrogenase [ubiquinone] 1 alpha subcomplex assembly factor 4 isoform X2 [Cyprinodon variegatus]